MKPKVLIGPAHIREIPYAYEPALTGAGFELTAYPEAKQLTEAELLEVLPGCVASLAGSEPYTRAVIERAAHAGLKVIARAGVGYDGVDVAAATEFGVVVTYAPGANHEAVAEQTIGLMINLVKDIPRQSRLIAQGQWPRNAQRPLRGTTLGLIGFGRTGKAVARRAAAFDMTILAVDPVQDLPYAEQYGVTFVGLPELLQRSDVVSLHVPLTSETRYLIKAETLAMMKPTAFLVNAARGGVVHEPDLHQALVEKRIAGAALDVFEQEPPGLQPMFQLDNLLMTAHTAGVDMRSRDDMASFAARAIVRLFAGEWPLEWIVNPEVPTSLKR